MDSWHVCPVAGTSPASMFVRPYLVEADKLYEPEVMEMFLPTPTKRVRGKSTLAALQKIENGAKRRQDLEAQAENLAKELLRTESFEIQDVLDLYAILEKLGQLNTSMHISSTTTTWYAGMYVEGGMAGIRVGSRRTPWTAKYMVKFAKKQTGQEQFTAVGITRNASLGIHRGIHNHGAAITKEIDNLSLVALWKG